MPTASSAPLFDTILPEATDMPLYRAAKRALLRAIESGRCAPGATLPSETTLAHAMGVSIGTLRRAVDELTAERVLVRRQGRGTFVAATRESAAMRAFFPLQHTDGRLDQPTFELLHYERHGASTEVADALALPAGEAVFHIEARWHLRDRPVIHEHLSLPAAQFEGLTAERLRACHGLLYPMYQAAFGVTVLRARERTRAGVADRLAARWLEVAVGHPLLRVRRTAYSYDDRPVEYRHSLLDTTEHEVLSLLTRPSTP